MKVILKENVKSLGNVGEIVNVLPGHARNFLIPKKLAVLADGANKKQMEDYQKMLAKKIEESKKEASDLAKKIGGLTVAISKKIGGSGKLFGAVTTADIVNELAKHDIVIERRMVVLENIKGLGTYDVKAKLFKDVEATFKLKVEMDAKQAEEMKAKQEAAKHKKAKGETSESEEEKVEENTVSENPEA